MIYNSNWKENKIWTLAKSLAYNFALSLFFTLLLGVIVINIFNLRLDEVLSNSMYPTISEKDIVVVMKQDEYHVDDIIEFRKGDILVTHRIVSYDENTKTYTTKGDFNNTEDGEVTIGQINGKVVAKWKNGRQVYHTIKNSYFVLISIVVGAWVLSTTIAGEIEMKKHNILKV